jgi:hypothetical protein
VIKGKLRDAEAPEGALAAEAEALKVIPGQNPPERVDVLALLKERLSGVDVRVFDEVGARPPGIEIVTNAQDKMGETALMKAAARGLVEAARELRSWQEENARDHNGRTAAMHAARNGQAVFVETLLTEFNSGHGTSVGSFGCHSMFRPEFTPLWARTPKQRPIWREPDAGKHSK